VFFSYNKLVLASVKNTASRIEPYLMWHSETTTHAGALGLILEEGDHLILQFRKE
jgi:hypothetical protein